MPAPPRIALLVHNRLEQDPRVSRHALAARKVGYRVAVLSVVTPGPQNSPGRWGQHSDGIAVFESRVLRRTLLGRLRRIALAAGSRGATPTLIPEPATVEIGTGSGSESSSLGGVVRDFAAIAMLVRNNVGLFKQFRGIGAGLVHANDLNVLPAAYLLARFWRVPLLYDSHELWVALDADWSPFRRRLYAMIERQLIRRADAVITVNGAIADELAHRYGVVRPDVVMNCPDLALVASPTTCEARSNAPGPMRVIYQGMLNANRGLVEAIDAMVGVKDVELAIRGPGALRDTLQRQIDARGLGHRIHLLPPVPMRDLVSALDGFAVGLVPYLPVGMNNLLCSPNKLFEYMAAGLAVVCSDLPVLRDIVESADSGFLVAPGDREALTNALNTLAGDRSLLARLQANARHAAQSRYNAAHEEDILLAIYARLLRKSAWMA